MRRKTAHRHKTWEVGLGIAGILFVAFGIQFGGTLLSRHERAPAGGSNMAAAPVLVRTHSPEEAKVFWENTMKDVIADKMRVELYELPEISERFKALVHKVKERYGKDLAVEASAVPLEVSPEVRSASYVDPRPTVVLFIPAAMDMYSDLKASGFPDWKKRFDTAIVIAFIHELDHLANGWTGHAGQTQSELVEIEGKAWAETCAHTISALKSHGYALEKSDARYYADWEACGKTEGACWTDATRRAYRNLLERMPT